MKIRRPLHALVFAVTLASPRGEAATPNATAPVTAGQLWIRQRVRYPVATADLSATDPFVPAGVPEVEGFVEVGPKRAAAFWLDPLDIVRVRQMNPAAAFNLHFARIEGNNPLVYSVSSATPGATPAAAPSPDLAHAVLEEPGIPQGPQYRYLSQPAGGGAVWYVDANVPTMIEIERPYLDSGRLAWETAEADVLRWIDRGGPMPPLPPGSSEVRMRLEAESEIARELSKAASLATKSAVRSWQKASALQQIRLLRPLLRPWFAPKPLESRLPGAGRSVNLDLDNPQLADANARAYREIPGKPEPLKVTLRGPGVLQLEARGLLQGQPPDVPPFELSVRTAGGVILGDRRFRPRQVRVPDPPEGTAFPAPTPLTIRSGEWVGEKERLAVPLLPGRHEYEILVAGGPMIARVAAARYSPSIGPALVGKTTPAAWAQAALAGMRRDRSPAAEALRTLLLPLSGPLPARLPAANVFDALPPVLRVVATIESLRSSPAGTGDARREVEARAVSALRALPPDAASPRLLWYLRVELTRILFLDEADAQIRVLLDGTSDPPAAALSSLAQFLPEPAPFRAMESRRLVYEEFAWREAPADPLARQRYLDLWNRETAWARLGTDHEENPGSFTLIPWSWLENRSPDWAQSNPVLVRSLTAFDDGLTWRMPTGVVRHVVATSAPFDPDRPAVLRVFVKTPAATPGPIRLRVGSKTWNLLGLSRLEQVLVAVPPGEPEIQVDGPEGTEAFVSLPPAEGSWPASPTDFARRLRFRPLVSEGVQTRYVLPDPVLSNTVQVQIASLVPADASALKTPIDVRVKADTGFTRSFTFWPGAIDPNAEAIEAPAAITAPLSFVVPVPPGNHLVWLETSARTPLTLVASISIRRPDYGNDGGPAALAAAAGARPRTLASLDPKMPAVDSDPLARLASISHRILLEPLDPSLYVARANLLLDLGEIDLAQQDAIRFLKLPAERAIEIAEDQVLERMTTWRQPSFVSIKDAPHPSDPIAVAPAVLAIALPAGSVDPAQRWLAIARTARVEGPAAGLAQLERTPDRGSAYGLYLRSRFLEAQGKDDASAAILADLYLSSRQWQFGLEALPIYRRVLSTGTQKPGDMPRIYGLAALLRQQIEFPDVRETLLASSVASQWEPITGTEANAGLLRLSMAAATEQVSPITAIREAILTPPWPSSEARIVVPGSGTVLDVTTAVTTRLRIEAWCQKVRVDDPNDRTPCEITYRLDGNPPVSSVAADSKVTTISVASVPPGRHRLEVLLEKESHSFGASLRFVADRALTGTPAQAGKGFVAIDVQRPARLVLAHANRPIQVTVLGPSALYVEARTTSKDRASEIEVEAKALETRTRWVRALTLDPAIDPSVTSEEDPSLQVSKPQDLFLLLPEKGPWTITIRPKSGTAIVRMGLRQDGAGDDTDPTAWEARFGEVQEIVPPPKIGKPLVAIEARRWDFDDVQKFGTVSAEIVAGSEHFSDSTEPDVQRNRVETHLTWRAETVADRLWFRADLAARQLESSSHAYGGSGEVFWRGLPLGLRFDATLSAFTQEYQGSGIQRYAASGRIDLPFAASPRVILIPSFETRYVRQSLGLVCDERATTAVPTCHDLDPVAWSRYSVFHPLVATPQLALWAYPFQDQIATTTVSASTDGKILDHAAASVEWRGLFLHSVEAGVSARRTFFFADPRIVLDANTASHVSRPRSYASDRLSAQIAPSVWTGRTGRIRLVGRAGWTRSGVASGRQDLEVGLRYDLVGGRRLDDMLPPEQSFDDLLGRRFWSQRGAERAP